MLDMAARAEAGGCPAVALRDVAVTYGSGATAVRAVGGVSLEVRTGEVLLLMGPSGSGKTSLLQVMGLLLHPDAGEVVLRGEPTATFDQRRMSALRRAHCGFVFQSCNLLPTLTAIENVMLAFELKGIADGDTPAEALRLLDRVGLAAKRDSYPSMLSGGQKQRIAVARAQVGNPDIILADEPTAALDSETGIRVIELLRSLADREKRAVVIVTHDGRVTRHADNIVRLQDGRVVNADGRKIEKGAP